LGRNKGGSFELPCRCRILIPDDNAFTFGAFFELPLASYKTSAVRTPENSLWGNEKLNNFRTKHISCDKDPNQEMRLMEILLRRRAVLNDELGLVKINKETNIADLSDSDCIESAGFYLELKEMFSQTLRNSSKPKKEDNCQTWSKKRYEKPTNKQKRH